MIYSDFNEPNYVYKTQNNKVYFYDITMFAVFLLFNFIYRDNL